MAHFKKTLIFRFHHIYMYYSLSIYIFLSHSISFFLQIFSFYLNETLSIFCIANLPAKLFLNNQLINSPIIKTAHTRFNANKKKLLFSLLSFFASDQHCFASFYLAKDLLLFFHIWSRQVKKNEQFKYFSTLYTYSYTYTETQTNYIIVVEHDTVAAETST